MMEMAKVFEEVAGKRCVDAAGREWDFTRPFNQGGFLYASDGHVAVRIPHEDGVRESKRTVPRMTILEWNREFYRDLPVDLGPIELPSIWEDFGPCNVCRGRWRGPQECPCCSGSGRERFEAKPVSVQVGAILHPDAEPDGQTEIVCFTQHMIHQLREWKATLYLAKRGRYSTPAYFTIETDGGLVEGIAMPSQPPDPIPNPAEELRSMP